MVADASGEILGVLIAADIKSTIVDHSDIAGGWVNVVGRGDPVFRIGMAVAFDEIAWEHWDRILCMGDAISRAGLGDTGGECVIANHGAAVGVESDGDALGAEVGSGQCGNGSAETVAGRNHAVAWVSSLSRLDGSGDGLLGSGPAGEETLVDLAGGAEERNSGKIDVTEPVEDGVGAPISNYNLLVLVVDGDETGCISCSLATKC